MYCITGKFAIVSWKTFSFLTGIFSIGGGPGTPLSSRRTFLLLNSTAFITYFQHRRAATQQSLSNLIACITEKSTIWPRYKTNASLTQFCTPQKWNLIYPKYLHFHTIALAKQEYHTVTKLCVMLQCGYVSSLPPKPSKGKKTNHRKKETWKVKQKRKEILHRTCTSNSFSFCKHAEFSLHETVLFTEYASSFTTWAISKLWI